MAALARWDTGDMDTPHPRDDEFDRLQSWFHPKRLKRILQEWHARYEPWTYKHPDERGITISHRNINDAPEIRRTEVAGSVQWALNQLAMREPVLYDVIVGFYLDVAPKHGGTTNPDEVNWEPRMSVFELADWQGIAPRTVYKREMRARYLMAEWLGWQREDGE